MSIAAPLDQQPSAEEVRAEARAWFEANWDPERPLAEWRDLLVDSGWACPGWPPDRYGRGLSPELARAATDELRAAGAVGPAVGVGMALAAPTLLEHGSLELQRRLLRGIATGRDTWCQLFSEPSNGSDLAGLTTHARRDGDEWIVTGQKVWTTGAHHAAYGMLLARTDPDVPKHRGISFFAFPMRQSGVEVRPLRQMNGRASFNEVFIDEARVPHADLVGELHGGWAVARTTLSHERGLAAGLFGSLPPAGGGRTREEAAAEAGAYLKTYEWYPQRAGRADLVSPLAQRLGRSGDPVLRQEMAAVHALQRAAQLTAQRATAKRRAGRPGPAGSLGKLHGSAIARAAAAAHTNVAGAHAMLDGPDSLEGGIVAEVLVSVPGQSIAGGTDEIQHDIIGERVLGLPKEPSVDADIPFRDVRSNRRPGS
jgi:alkylation response protein AidB-like acyl-CoA dehydrogenase